ncbi:hypothetical protein GCM10027446_05060 [Angustibacter peucedani]
MGVGQPVGPHHPFLLEVLVRLLGRLVAVAAAAAVLAGAVVAGVAWHQGWRIYAVRTGSMDPTFPVGALVVDAPARGALPPVGEVVTFETTQGVVTHRVHEQVPGGVRTQGDANASPDAWTVAPRHVVGVVRFGVPRAGYLLVFLRQPTGVPSLVVLMLSVALAWSVFFPAQASGSAGRPVARLSRAG